MTALGRGHLPESNPTSLLADVDRGDAAQRAQVIHIDHTRLRADRLVAHECVARVGADDDAVRHCRRALRVHDALAVREIEDLYAAALLERRDKELAVR